MKHLISIALVCLAGVILLTACGKKGPPLPSIKEGNVLAAPADLAYSLEGDLVTLTWTHAADPVNAKIEPEAFEVFMAVKEPGSCEGCPFVFESMGLVPLPAMTYHHVLKKGPHYYFRLQAIGKNEVRSSYSKTLSINVEN